MGSVLHAVQVITCLFFVTVTTPAWQKTADFVVKKQSSDRSYQTGSTIGSARMELINHTQCHTVLVSKE